MPETNANRFLEALTSDAREQILSKAWWVALPTRTVLQAWDERPEYLYLLTGGLASVVVSGSAGQTVETGLIGREGLVGALSLLGGARAATACFMQLEGQGYRVPLADMQELFCASEPIRTQVLACVQQQSLTTQVLTGCNRLHEAGPRLARWLLTAQNLTGNHTLTFTQDFLAEMLGSQRTTVALEAGSLQQAGLIGYSRGKIVIQSREGLVNAACSCYGIVQRLLDELYAANPDSPGARPSASRSASLA